MPQPVIEVERLTKRFGSETAVNDVSFTFERGRIYGIVGRNGSGKTVLLKCILGLMPVTAGRIRILGAPVDSRSLAHVGMIIEAPGFLPGYDAFRNLWMLASIRGRADRERVRESIRLVGLDPHSRKSVGKYSLGMRQRLGIAQAIMEDPDVLLLDEPMNGLDNRGVEDMRALCSRVMVLGHGQLLYDGTLTNLLHRYDTAHTLTVTYDGAADASKLPQGAVKDGDTWRITLQKDGDLSRTMQQVMAAGKMHEMAIEEQNVDELIARMYREMAL